MRPPRIEGIVQVLILIAVAGMAGAASFTHVHDWTMRNAPHGTPTWFGWANAVITELVPAAAGIEIRRRKRQHRKVTYPMTILIIDAGVSVAVQLSDALHTLAGGVAFALPVLAFLALTKLVLSRTHTETGTSESSRAEQTHVSEEPEHSPAQLPASGELNPVPSAQLLASARMTAFAYHQASGRLITAEELAERLGVPVSFAESLLDHVGGTSPPVTTVNGAAISGSRP